jgi:hypothetical protein
LGDFIIIYFMLGRTKIVSMCLKIVTYTFKALLPVQLFLNRKRQFYMSGCWYEWLLVHVTSYNFIDNYYPSLLLVEFCYRSFFVHITAISNQKKLVLYEWLFVRVTSYNFIGWTTPLLLVAILLPFWLCPHYSYF